jgi:multidrug efflux pump subunit AcrB
VLEAAARALADELKTFDGVQDIDDGIELGKPQLDFTLSEAGKAAGLQAVDVARQLRAAFYGVEAIRQQRGRNEIRVMVRLPRVERESLATVEGLMIRTPSGGEIPLSQAADVLVGRAYTTLERTDGRRTLRVRAAVDHKKANAQEVMASLKAEALPRLMARYPGLSHSMAGRQRSMNEFMTYLKVAYMMALLVMYALIAVPLKSYLQPLLVVMAAIPFGFVGAVLGHLFMGVDMSLVSMMGFVALSGVVVNDSIVLVDAANHFRRKGKTPYEAALEASVMRFRPIVLTSLTTFAGLMPMILEQSVQARVLIPMAISLGFGVLFATIVILLLVPSFFVMVENLRAMIGRLRGDPVA